MQPFLSFLFGRVSGDLVTSQRVNAPVDVVSLCFPRRALNEHFVLDPSNDHTAKPNTGVQDLGGRRCLPEGDQGDSLPGC